MRRSSAVQREDSRRLGGSDERESKPERGAVCRFARHSHPAAMQLNNFSCDVEAESQAGSGGGMSGDATGAIEPLPDPVEVGACQAWSEVAHRYPDTRAADRDLNGDRSVRR